MSQPIQERVDELISGITTECAIKLFGDDLEVLREKAEEKYVAAKTLATQKCREYEPLVSDRHDGEIFSDAKALRDRFFAAADKLAALVKDGKEVEVEFDIRNHFRKGPIPLYNVIADLPGTEHPEPTADPEAAPAPADPSGPGEADA